MFRMLILLFTLSATIPAVAQEFPKKQAIKIVVAFNPGGSTDLLARITADLLQQRLGQAVIVENKPGAAGAIAVNYLAKAPPDGYTLMLAAADLAILPAVRTNLPYDLGGFSYLMRFLTQSTLIVVRKDSPFSSVRELIAYMKANPGKLTFGSTGFASLNHLGTLKFESATGVQALHVAYSGQAPILTAILGGTTDFYTGGAFPLMDNIKVLGPAGSRRHERFPDLPTLDELGYTNATYDAWFGLIAPPNLPQPIADRLISELQTIYKDPEVIAKFRLLAGQAPDDKLLIGPEFQRYAIEQRDAWKDVADREHVVVQ